jgi:hypothetical protein
MGHPERFYKNVSASMAQALLSSGKLRWSSRLLALGGRREATRRLPGLTDAGVGRPKRRKQQT